MLASEVIEKATMLSVEHEVKNGNSWPTTPEESELKEDGYIPEARKLLRKDQKIPSELLQEPPVEYERVRFRCSFPAIMGLDLKTYGPFDPGIVVEIPHENAEALIHHGIAEPLIAQASAQEYKVCVMCGFKTTHVRDDNYCCMCGEPYIYYRAPQCAAKPKTCPMPVTVLPERQSLVYRVAFWSFKFAYRCRRIGNKPFKARQQPNGREGQVG